jgi:hypothetical protein
MPGVAALVASTLVLHALLALPPWPPALGWAAFARLPLELPVLIALMLALPGRGTAAALARGALVAALGAATVLKLADLALHDTFSRPFNPVTDLFVFPAAANLLQGALGPALAAAVLAAAALALLGLLGLIAWSLRAWGRVPLGRGARGAAAGAALLGAVAILAEAGHATRALPLALDLPGQAETTAFALRHHARARAATRDLAIYRLAAARDPYPDAHGLLDRLGGRDVGLYFVESYGRASIDAPLYAPTHRASLERAARELARAGLEARSFWLTSPIAGGQSWLAHGTLASGLRTADQASYGAMLASPRATLFHLARDAGYRTAAVMPAITLPWPEGPLLGFETILEAAELGYRGAPFNWVTMPDQYTLAAYPGLLPPDPRPLFLKVALISSHAPWVPIPPLIPWAEVGDGRVFDRWALSGDPPGVVWRDRDRVRAQYRLAVDYALRTVFAHIARQAGDGALSVVLGDHPPVAWVSQVEGRDVPIHLVGPPEALAPFDAWGASPGLIPAPDAPVWPMEAFRDRFLAATRARPEGAS